MGQWFNGHSELIVLGLFTVAPFLALFLTLCRSFCHCLLFLPGFSPPFSVRSTKRVEDQQKRGPARNSAGNGKKGAKKGAKKGYCETPAFSSLFHALFGFLSPFHAACVLILFLKGHIPPQMFKRTGVNFSGFYSRLSARHEKGSKKGVKKGDCEEPYSVPGAASSFSYKDGLYGSVFS
jgi:hypothetical protein